MYFRFVQLIWSLQLCESHQNRAWEQCQADLQVCKHVDTIGNRACGSDKFFDTLSFHRKYLAVIKMLEIQTGAQQQCCKTNIDT